MLDRHTTTTGPKGPGRFRKKSVEVEAMHLTEHVQPEEIARWCGGEVEPHPDEQHTGGRLTIAIDTLEGTMRANPGDWIIRGVQGEFYPCKPDIFAATYEPAEQDHPALSLGRKDRERLEEIAELLGVHVPGGSSVLAPWLRDLAKHLGDGGQGEAEPALFTINRLGFRVPEGPISGEQLRQMPMPPITEEYELYKQMGEFDAPVAPHEELTIKAGDAFYVAPKTITAGQPVPSCLSEEVVREKLLGEDAVDAGLRAARGVTFDVTRDRLADEPTGHPSQHDAVRAAFEAGLAIALSTSSDTGGAENSGQDWMQTSLATVLQHLESEMRSAGELADAAPIGSTTRTRHATEEGTYRYVLKQIAEATSPQQSVPDTGEKECEQCGGRGSVSISKRSPALVPCGFCNGTGKKQPDPPGEVPGREGGDRG